MNYRAPVGKLPFLLHLAKASGEVKAVVDHEAIDFFQPGSTSSRESNSGSIS